MVHKLYIQHTVCLNKSEFVLLYHDLQDTQLRALKNNKLNGAHWEVKCNLEKLESILFPI